jgi:hypothetical protein
VEYSDYPETLEGEALHQIKPLERALYELTVPDPAPSCVGSCMNAEVEDLERWLRGTEAYLSPAMYLERADECGHLLKAAVREEYYRATNIEYREQLFELLARLLDEVRIRAVRRSIRQ